MAEQVRPPMMSGWCSHPATNTDSHKRCSGGNRANPEKMFQPCPCVCHLDTEEYECECGGTLVQAPIVAAVTGEEVWVHTREDERKHRGEFCS